MKRYTLTINGKNNVGLIHWGDGLGLLTEEDLVVINNKLPIPDTYKGERKPYCYFTEAGLKQFGSILEILQVKVKSEQNILEAKLVVINLESVSLLPENIFYKDIYQWIVLDK